MTNLPTKLQQKASAHRTCLPGKHELATAGEHEVAEASWQVGFGFGFALHIESAAEAMQALLLQSDKIDFSTQTQTAHLEHDVSTGSVETPLVRAPTPQRQIGKLQNSKRLALLHS